MSEDGDLLARYGMRGWGRSSRRRVRHVHPPSKADFLLAVFLAVFFGLLAGWLIWTLT